MAVLVVALAATTILAWGASGGHRWGRSEEIPTGPWPVVAQGPTATPTGNATPRPGASATPPPRAPVEHTVEILSVRPHDRNAFTQGLLLYQGRLFESTGRRGASTVREVDPYSGAVLRQARLPASDFGEGLARVGDRLIQLTWQENVAHVWDLETFAPRDLLAYSGEGWGLCYDGERLVMTDGGDRLLFRDPETFALLGAVEVTMAGRPLAEVNELECVGDRVWANVWFEDFVVAIDPETGVVTDRVDASALAERVARDYPSVSINVLNGIAYDRDTGHWLMTGKLWPSLFEVRMVPGVATATPLLLPRLEGGRRGR